MLPETGARKGVFAGVFVIRLYNRENAMKLSVMMLMMLSVVSCAASQPSSPTPWKLSLTSEGGLAGRGNGSYSIDSDGAIQVTTAMGKSCSYRASAEELQRFQSLINAASPQRWSAAYIPEDSCCDRFQYALTATIGEKETKTAWIDDPLPMPADLVAIADALITTEQSLRVKYGLQCR
jgi:hypothetical protein